jgi:hypothetical protein
VPTSQEGESVVPRVPPFHRPATCEDLIGQPDDLLAEILDGELHANPRPSALVAGSAFTLGGMLRRACSGGSPDSWQILHEPELRLGADVLVPALAGWRLTRLPVLPRAAYFSVAPDWVCDILSSGTASFRARKMALYAAEGVSHAWLLDPATRTLEVRRLEDDRWSDVATYVGDRPVRAEPFEAVDLSLGALWPGAPEDRRNRRR